MTRVVEKVKRAAGRKIEEVELRLLAQEGRRSIREKVAVVKRVTKKAVKAGLVTGAVVATAVVMRERRKRRKLAG